jgi:hypothetical protein
MAELDAVRKYEFALQYNLIGDYIHGDSIRAIYQVFREFYVNMPEQIRNLPECYSVENCFQKIVPNFTNKLYNMLTFGFYRKGIISKIKADSGILIGKAKQHFSGIQQEMEKSREYAEQLKNYYESQISALRTEFAELKEKHRKEIMEYEKKLKERESEKSLAALMRELQSKKASLIPREIFYLYQHYSEFLANIKNKSPLPTFQTTLSLLKDDLGSSEFIDLASVAGYLLDMLPRYHVEIPSDLPNEDRERKKREQERKMEEFISFASNFADSIDKKIKVYISGIIKREDLRSDLQSR